MAKMNVKVTGSNNIPEVIAEFERINKTTAKVGYMKNEELKKIAGVHEFGMNIAVTPKMRAFLMHEGLFLKESTKYIVIPERSFMRNGSKEAEKDISNKVEQLLPAVVNLNLNVKEFYKALGLELKGKIQKFARDLKSPANHPFTVERKNSENPLVQSGEMIQKMEVEVE